MCACGFLIIVPCQCRERLCNILSLRRFASFVLFLMVGFLSNSRQVQLMNFHFTTSLIQPFFFIVGLSLKMSSVIAKIKKDFLRGMCIEWDFDCLWGGCVNMCFLPPEIPLPVSLCLFLTRTIGCCHTLPTEL